MSEPAKVGGARHKREGEPPPLPEPLAVPVADAHAHLDLMGGDGERAVDDPEIDEALALARAVGVTRVVTIGIDVPTSAWAARTAAGRRGLAATVAIHPNEAGKGVATDAALAALDDLASHESVRAVGETGLDHFRTEDEAGWLLQEASLRAHAEIAKRHGKPLVVHDRDAHADVLRVLDAATAPETVVIHAFSGDAEFARACAQRGWVCSFAGNSTFKNAQSLRDAVAALPRELILVETDAPFLTPMPFRGRPNAPYLIPLTLRALAEARGEHVDDLARAVDATTTRVFGDF
ncbi:MAG TPA: TatD family hydrolase [Mycobacteriales bacterium]|nr:TatD family hydrolase [Mycobacteriales bacterium]